MHLNNVIQINILLDHPLNLNHAQVHYNADWLKVFHALWTICHGHNTRIRLECSFYGKIKYNRHLKQGLGLG